jgi:predicted CXXCH cytochrome family protein
MRPSFLTVLLAALATALAAAEDLSAETGGMPPPKVIDFVMPAAGALIPTGPVVVAGHLPENAGSVILLADGIPVATLVREGDMFSATLVPAAGPHVLEARAGDLAARLTYRYGPNYRDLPPYRYHAPVLEHRCAECHAGVRRPSATAEGDTCKNCHRKLAMVYPYVHGPLAVGKCLVCHDAHGSSWPSLTIADARTMCTGCHDQPESLAHVQLARSRVCYLCHNPHAGMNRKFLYDIVK